MKLVGQDVQKIEPEQHITTLHSRALKRVTVSWYSPLYRICRAPALLLATYEHYTFCFSPPCHLYKVSRIHTIR